MKNGSILRPLSPNPLQWCFWMHGNFFTRFFYHLRTPIDKTTFKELRQDKVFKAARSVFLDFLSSFWDMDLIWNNTPAPWTHRCFMLPCGVHVRRWTFYVTVQWVYRSFDATRSWPAGYSGEPALVSQVVSLRPTKGVQRGSSIQGPRHKKLFVGWY